MSDLLALQPVTRRIPLLGSFLDNLIHPHREAEDDDPGAPFTPPPSQPSKQEDDDEDDGPTLPMDPALA